MLKKTKRTEVKVRCLSSTGPVSSSCMWLVNIDGVSFVR